MDFKGPFQLKQFYCSAVRKWHFFPHAYPGGNKRAPSVSSYSRTVREPGAIPVRMSSALSPI